MRSTATEDGRKSSFRSVITVHWLIARALSFQEYQLANRLLVFATNGQIYFSCREAVYSEEVLTGATFESDASMQNGAEMIKIRPDSSRLWSGYRDAVELYTSRKLTNEGDVIDAFSGVLQCLYSGRCVEGIPKTLFDIALLWQPHEKSYRRKGFPSWSWIGWKGCARWPDVSLPHSEEEEDIDEAKAIEKWVRNNTWIVWHSSSFKACHSPAFQNDGPPWLLGSDPDQLTQEERFPGLSKRSKPTSTLMSDCIKGTTVASPDQRFLQFWTVSVQLQIELERTAVLRYASLRPGNTGNGLRRFIAYEDARPCGWVLLDEEWIERLLCDNGGIQEFILLSEARYRYQDWDTQRRMIGSSEGRRYNAMMIVWQGGIAERAGLGEVVIDKSVSAKLEWKEVLLG